MAISEPWVRINGQLHSLPNFQEKFGSNHFCWKCPKTQFWGPLTENLNSLQVPIHTLTLQSMNTQNRSTNYLWIYHGMHWTLCYRSKLFITLKSKDLDIPVAFKTIPDTPTKTHWSWAQFQKGQLSLCKTTRFSPLTSVLESFGHKCTPSYRPWVEAYTAQNSS